MRPSWYLSKVKEKENKDWTTPEMVRVYTLRVNDQVPVKEVAEMLKVTDCQVHNVTRIMRKAVRGFCYKCGNKLTEKELISKKPDRIIHLCFKCREKVLEYKRNRREKFIEYGLCGYCGKRKKLPGKDSCQLCISATHRRRERAGLCGYCGKNPIRPGHPNGALCSICAIKMSLNRTTV